MTTTETDYDKLAAGNGWATTRGLTIEGLPATVWQRGQEILVHPEVPGGFTPAGFYDGRRVEDVAVHLAADPRRPLLTMHITADREGIIANLAVMQAERNLQSGNRQTQRESRRLAAEAAGLGLAISVLQAWEGQS